jgi:hypothetical protein
VNCNRSIMFWPTKGAKIPWVWSGPLDMRETFQRLRSCSRLWPCVEPRQRALYFHSK